MKSVILALALLAGAEAFSPAQLGAKLRTRARSSVSNVRVSAESAAYLGVVDSGKPISDSVFEQARTYSVRDRWHHFVRTRSGTRLESDSPYEVHTRDRQPCHYRDYSSERCRMPPPPRHLLAITPATRRWCRLFVGVTPSLLPRPVACASTNSCDPRRSTQR